MISLEPNGTDQRYWSGVLSTLEAAHGFKHGYKLLYCPWKTLERHKLVFLSLNPGTRTPRGADPRERLLSDERGNSYEVDRAASRSPMSGQFLRMCRFLKCAPGDVLTGVVAPFRSRGWDSLTPKQRRASVEFGRRSWGWVWSDPFRGATVVVSSAPAAQLMVSVLGAEPERELDSGWGSVRIWCYRARGGRRSWPSLAPRRAHDAREPVPQAPSIGVGGSSDSRAAFGMP